MVWVDDILFSNENLMVDKLVAQLYFDQRFAGTNGINVMMYS